MASQHSLRRGAAAALALAALALVSPAPVAAETMVHPGPPSFDGATATLTEAQAQRDEATARRTQLQAELVATRQEIAGLGLEQVALAHELEIARRRVRVVTVRAYTGGAGAREYEAMMDVADLGDHLYRSELLAGNAIDTDSAIEEYQELRRQADATVVELAERVDEIRAGIEQAGRDIVVAQQAIGRAQVELSAARAMAGASRTDPGEAAWERLRFCESGGVYSINTGNGFYGAYQFDLQTWQSMNGTGLPSAAPYWEQDLRAKALYQTRGSQPWPVCGRFLD